MKLLLDANLSPRLVGLLRDAGYDTTHVADIELATATDPQIFDHAVAEGFAVVTADSDFPMLLALRRAESPSVIHLRHVAELGPDDHVELLLANPVQRRLNEHEVDHLVRDYLAGSSIDALAAQLAVHRTTIMKHLDRRGTKRRRSVRRMTDRSVPEAAKRYAAGESLKVVATCFNVDARTLARESERTGVHVRARRGWPACLA